MLIDDDAILSLTHAEIDVGIGTAELPELAVAAADFAAFLRSSACVPSANENDIVQTSSPPVSALQGQAAPSKTSLSHGWP